jgi:glycosyltransferase involved in cell wall biosynthesis
MIIHVLPENEKCCGGIKVHYDLCEIERDLNIKSVIAFPNKDKIPKWFKRNVGKILSYEEAKELGYQDKKKRKDVLVIGWEDPDILNNNFKDFIHCCYIQGDVFWRGFYNYPDKFILCGNNYIKKKIQLDSAFVIEPFIRPEIFYPSKEEKFKELPYKVLVQARKGGKEAVEKLKSFIPNSSYEGKLEFEILEDVNEKQFADKLREADIFFAHSFPEGFGLPPLEAMTSKTLVIGFSGGGGKEFMENNENCFYVADDDYGELTRSIWKLLYMSKNQLEVILLNALTTSKKYCKETTKLELTNFLRRINLNL